MSIFVIWLVVHIIRNCIVCLMYSEKSMENSIHIASSSVCSYSTEVFRRAFCPPSLRPHKMSNYEGGRFWSVSTSGQADCYTLGLGAEGVLWTVHFDLYARGERSATAGKYCNKNLWHRRERTRPVTGTGQWSTFRIFGGVITSTEWIGIGTMDRWKIMLASGQISAAFSNARKHAKYVISMWAWFSYKNSLQISLHKPNICW